jgi:hypothetical protein
MHGRRPMGAGKGRSTAPTLCAEWGVAITEENPDEARNQPAKGAWLAWKSRDGYDRAGRGGLAGGDPSSGRGNL